MRLAHRKALVTGGGRGIGRAIALRLAQEGADVAILDRQPARAAETVALIRELGRRSLSVTADVSKVEDLPQAVQAAADGLGGISVLVNAAGVLQMKRITEVTPDDWDEVMGTNTRGLFFCCQAALPYLKQNPGTARVINISSSAAIGGRPVHSVYGLSKAAVVNITKSYALAVAGDGITVNAILPGPVETDMWQDLAEQLAAIRGVAPGQVMQDVVSSIPMRRLGKPEEIAGMVAYLASDEASFVTGAALTICGGLTV